MVDALNLLTGVLPGVKVAYYGEEIGMEDTYIRPDQILDTYQFNRDPYRTPMQWNNSISAGFSSKAKSWLPVNPNYWWLNVTAQQGAENSHLKVFQAMAQTRQSPVLQRGSLDVIAPDNDTFLIVRHYNDSYFLLLVNMGSEVLTYTSQSLFDPFTLDMDWTVAVASVNSDYRIGTKVKQDTLA